MEVEWTHFLCSKMFQHYLLFQAYNITIKDREQPLLVSKPKEKDRRGGRTQMLYLVPELCFMTGWVKLPFIRRVKFVLYID